MSTPQSSADDQPTPESTEQTPPVKKTRRSLGFIESSEFQPSWLETGPLSPEMLAALKEQAEEEIKTSEDKPAQISGGYTQRLAALERLYDEQEERRTTDSYKSTEQSVPDTQTAETGKLVEATDDAPGELDDPIEELVSVGVDTHPAVGVYDAPAGESAEEDEVRQSVPIEPALEVTAAVAEDEAAAVEDTSGPSVGEEVELPVPPDPVVDTILTGAQTTAATPSVGAAVPRQHPLLDGLARRLLIFGLVFTGLALLTLLVNPFQRLALGTATQARPVASPDVAAPTTASGAWCLTGDVLGDGQGPLPMVDTGQNGDVVAGDNIFALEFAPQQSGNLGWQAIDCQNPALAYPPAGAWVQAAGADQPATFFFDSNRRDDPLFFAIPFVVTALDGSADFRLVGSFQGWDPNDPSNRLERVAAGVYQQVRQIDRPGRYEAYAISGDMDRAIDAYGRTGDPIPFSFEITEPDDYAVFLVDTNRGRASVLYGMPRLMTAMAYGNGYRAITALLGLIGLTLLGWMLARMAIMGNQSRWLDAGCPECGQHELIRVSRQSQDRFLHFLGLPTYRYQCRVCTWQGTKLSEGGTPVSPGATITVNDLPRQRYR